MLAAAGLVVDRVQEIPGRPARSEERPGQVAEMLTGQSPQYMGMLLHRPGRR
jgi:hypothetical protein